VLTAWCYVTYSDDVTSQSTVSSRVTSAGDVICKDDVTDDAAVTCDVFADDERVTSLESKHQMSLQSMKELLLGSVSVARCTTCSVFHVTTVRNDSHRRTSQRGSGAAAPDSGKAIILRAKSKVFGQKPAAKNEKCIY